MKSLWKLVLVVLVAWPLVAAAQSEQKKSSDTVDSGTQQKAKKKKNGNKDPDRNELDDEDNEDWDG